MEHSFFMRKKYTFTVRMQPDYPHKLFNDKRVNYSLLMLTLAMDPAFSRC